jgi:hypothetical protein
LKALDFALEPAYKVDAMDVVSRSGKGGAGVPASPAPMMRSMPPSPAADEPDEPPAREAVVSEDTKTLIEGGERGAHTHTHPLVVSFPLLSGQALYFQCGSR